MDTRRIVTTIIDTLDAALSCPRRVITLAVTTLVAGGHLLLEDVPGVGKTTLARALSLAIGGSVRRIQFTPDMLPTDLTGVSIYDQRSESFVFHRGPLFSNIVIADEVNRANPKTQSAMLEAMAEGQISVDGNTYPLPDPYFVVATQNPIELEGTYPLPEAQLDRFMVCTSIGYPTSDAEASAIVSAHSANPLQGVSKLCTVTDVAAARLQAQRVHIDRRVADYIVALAEATRRHPAIRYGASPRASLNLAAIAKARALIAGRDFVLVDDVQELAASVLAHRLVMADGGASGLRDRRAIVRRIISATPVPRASRATIS